MLKVTFLHHDIQIIGVCVKLLHNVKMSKYPHIEAMIKMKCTHYYWVFITPHHSSLWLFLSSNKSCQEGKILNIYEGFLFIYCRIISFYINRSNWCFTCLLHLIYKVVLQGDQVYMPNEQTSQMHQASKHSKSFRLTRPNQHLKEFKEKTLW